MAQQNAHEVHLGVPFLTAEGLAEKNALLTDCARTIRSLQAEVENLSDKLARNEPEGWEGSRRRYHNKTVVVPGILARIEAAKAA